MWMPFIEEEECLRESQEHNRIDDTKRKHVTSDHSENHSHERSSDPYCSKIQFTNQLLMKL